jgi:hypothetical protein
MQERNVRDLISEIEDTTPTETNVRDVISNLGEYQENPASTSLLSEYGQTAKQGLANVSRGTQLLARGAAPAVTGATAGYMAGGPIGGMLGSVAIPFGDTLNSLINRAAKNLPESMQFNLRMPSEIISTNLEKAGLRAPTTQTGRLIETAGSGLGGVGSELSSMLALAKSANPVLRQIGEMFTERAGRQLATAPTAAAGGQYVAEETDSPFAGLLASLGIGSTAGISGLKKAKGAPSHEELVLESKNLYDKAKQSGVQFDTTKFADEMFKVSQQLRDEGFHPKTHGGIANVLEELTNVERPKDFRELQAVRKMIQGQQKSADPETRRLASILKDDFDNYLLNAPDTHITTGSKEGTKLWGEARNSYSRLKKSEIFDDMLQQAEFEGPSLFTQSGTENSLAKQLRQLAKNDKKMRTFTKEEQDAIREAAKGGTAQNMLRFYGKFAPTGAVPGFLNVIASGANPVIGLPFALGATGARAGATAMRENAIENLGARMRLGQAPEMTSRLNPQQALIGAQQGAQQPYRIELRDMLPNRP